jgi:hypothetical protein
MRSLKGNIVCFVVSVHAILMKIRRDNEKSAHERPSLGFSSSGAKIIAKPDINSYLKVFLKYSFKKINKYFNNVFKINEFQKNCP